jgi:hypothetical protein
MNNIIVVIILLISIYLLYNINKNTNQNKKDNIDIQISNKAIKNKPIQIYQDNLNEQISNKPIQIYQDNLNEKKYIHNSVDDNINIDNHNYKTSSYMMYPQCNRLVGDHGKTCRQTKGCYYDNSGCHHDWKNIF